VNGDQLGEAFRRLQTRLRRNRLIQEVSRQRRHEKKGVKRRRLSSERWRRMFANEVFIFLALFSQGCAHACAGAEESATC
jgi:ribosomal protein S21